MSVSIKSAILKASQSISGDTAQLDAELLLCHLLDVNRTYLRTWPEQELNTVQQALFERLVARRANAEPVAYITGKQAFWSLELSVNADTLIPRPETELLVEQSLDKLGNIKSPMILDLGTGSGAIALALALERPDAQIFATDSSVAALKVARSNAQRYHLGNVEFVHTDWGRGLQANAFDLVVSNPPYIAADDPDLASDVRRYEPQSALISADEGLHDIRLIAQQAIDLLKPGGWLLVEHGWKQAAAVQKILSGEGFVDVQTLKDLAGHDRVTLVRRQ